MMIEIIILVIVSIMLAKHGGRPRKRRFRRYIRGNVEEQLVLTTLGPGVIVGTAFDEAVVERTFVSSLVATWSMAEFTPATDDGPITVGISHGDYTDVEIAEWMDNTASWSEADLVQQEVAKRKIRKVGTFLGPGVGGATNRSVLADGRLIKTKLNWILTTGQTLRMWAMNEGASALGTTAPIIRVNGHVNLWPR